MTGRTGCGLCGATTLEQAIRHPKPVGNGSDLVIRAVARSAQ
jgi:FdhD protein